MTKADYRAAFDAHETAREEYRAGRIGDDQYLAARERMTAAEASLAARAARKNARQRAARAARNDAMKSLGLVRVRGALGGVYWE